MKKGWLITIVRNAVYEIAKEFGVELDANVEFEVSDFRVEFKIVGKGLSDRSLTVHHNNQYGYSVSHGIHSPSDTKSDMLQLMIVGKVANRLFIENKL